MRRFSLFLAVAVLAGCGGEEHGKATLWITRDRGAHVIMQRQVPAGLTAMQALDRVADIDTRYGGRYVQAINGVRGSLSARRDWFYFINGYEADRSAAEYRLHEGDVEWWDFRSWRGLMRAPIVVGAFPEPFLHGFDGKRRPARVVYFTRSQRAAAKALARFIHGRATTNAFSAEAVHANILLLTTLPGRSLRAQRLSDPRPGSQVAFVFAGDPKLLLQRPPFGHLRYEAGS